MLQIGNTTQHIFSPYANNCFDVGAHFVPLLVEFFPPSCLENLVLGVLVDEALGQVLELGQRSVVPPVTKVSVLVVFPAVLTLLRELFEAGSKMICLIITFRSCRMHAIARDP